MLRLITIPISHYCEKARWALDRMGLEYVEEAHLQVFHYAATLGAGGGVTAPVLVHEHGVLDDSNAICRWASHRRHTTSPLYPPDRLAEVEHWVALLDRDLGVPGRLIMYQECLAHPDDMMQWMSTGAPAYQARMLRRAFGLARRFVTARLGVSAVAAQHGRDTCLRVFDDVAATISSNGHLVGSAFTAADLTFAALAAPVVLPPQYGVPLPPLDALPASYATLIEELRAHPAGGYALRLYRDERHRRLETRDGSLTE